MSTHLHEIRDRRRDTGYKEKAIGCRIRELRTARGISQEAIAANCGLRLNQIILLEDGRLNVTIVTLKSIVDTLNISLGDFFDGVTQGVPKTVPTAGLVGPSMPRNQCNTTQITGP